VLQRSDDNLFSHLWGAFSANLFPITPVTLANLFPITPMTLVNLFPITPMTLANLFPITPMLAGMDMQGEVLPHLEQLALSGCTPTPASLTASRLASTQSDWSSWRNHKQHLCKALGQALSQPQTFTADVRCDQCRYQG
jgi:hypothetical protein